MRDMTHSDVTWLTHVWHDSGIGALNTTHTTMLQDTVSLSHTHCPTHCSLTRHGSGICAPTHAVVGVYVPPRARRTPTTIVPHTLSPTHTSSYTPVRPHTPHGGYMFRLEPAGHQRQSQHTLSLPHPHLHTHLCALTRRDGCIRSAFSPQNTTPTTILRWHFARIASRAIAARARVAHSRRRCVGIYIYMYVYIHILVCIHKYIRACIAYSRRRCVGIYIYTWMYICIHLCIDKNIYMYIHAHV